MGKTTLMHMKSTGRIGAGLRDKIRCFAIIKPFYQCFEHMHAKIVYAPNSKGDRLKKGTGLLFAACERCFCMVDERCTAILLDLAALHLKLVNSRTSMLA